MKIKLFKELPKYQILYPIDACGRDINLYRFQDVQLTGHDLYYPNVLLQTSNNDLILPLLEKTMSLGSGTIYEKNNMEFSNEVIKMNEMNTVNKMVEYPVFFFIYNTDNYYHFVYDSLPYLISYLHLKKTIPNLKLLVQYPNPQKESFYTFFLEFLNILNIYQNDIILANSQTLYKNIYLSTSYTHDFNSKLPPRNEIYQFYQSIVKNVKELSVKETPKKLYISRRTWLHNDFSNIGTNYTTRRRLVNEDQLVSYLVENGFTEVFTENLSTIDKILYFAQAEMVIGAIGGGISNVLFSPPKTKLIALISPTFLEVNGRFMFSLSNVKTKYHLGTRHVETTPFKKYMRVKAIKDHNEIIGEIMDINGDELTISYTDGSNVGWNLNNTYQSIILKEKDVIPLDNGLNSAWEIIDINKIETE